MDADGLRLFFCQALADRKKSFGRLKRRPYRIPESLFLFGVFVVIPIHQIEYLTVFPWISLGISPFPQPTTFCMLLETAQGEVCAQLPPCVCKCTSSRSFKLN
jgi:hypothetical protein